MDVEMRAHKNIQSPGISITSQNNPIFGRDKLETSCLKGESHGQKYNQLLSLWTIKASKTNAIRKASYTCKFFSKNGEDIKQGNFCHGRDKCLHKWTDHT